MAHVLLYGNLNRIVYVDIWSTKLLNELIICIELFLPTHPSYYAYDIIIFWQVILMTLQITLYLRKSENNKNWSFSVKQFLRNVSQNNLNVDIECMKPNYALMIHISWKLCAGIHIWWYQLFGFPIQMIQQLTVEFIQQH